jgi:hypothetical protein
MPSVSIAIDYVDTSKLIRNSSNKGQASRRRRRRGRRAAEAAGRDGNVEVWLRRSRHICTQMYLPTRSISTQLNPPTSTASTSQSHVADIGDGDGGSAKPKAYWGRRRQGKKAQGRWQGGGSARLGAAGVPASTTARGGPSRTDRRQGRCMRRSLDLVFGLLGEAGSGVVAAL